MKWITIQLLILQLKIVKKQRLKQEDSILIKAYDNMIQSYKHAIMFLKAHNKTKI